MTGSCIRSYVLSKLSNNETLSSKEVQEHARQCLVTLQNHYITTNTKTQVQRQVAMSNGYDFLCDEDPLYMQKNHPVPITLLISHVQNPYLKKVITKNPYAKQAVMNPYYQKKPLLNQPSAKHVLNPYIKKRPFKSYQH